MSASLNLPDIFVENVLGASGPAGLSWLDELPPLISHFESKWNMSVGENFPNLTYNFVAPVVMNDGRSAVLKLILPATVSEFHGQAAYLRHNGSKGVIKLLREDSTKRALLLERADPGLDLKKQFSVDPKSAVEVGVHLLRQISRGSARFPGSFVHLKEWATKLSDASRFSFPLQTAARAMDIFASAKGTGGDLLHGDFHHTNILSSGYRSYLVIDPKGVIGDLRYDIAVFLNNHHDWLRDRADLRCQLDYAVARFAREFGFSNIQIRNWAYAQRTLGSLWTLLDGGDGWRDQLASAEIWDV